MIPQGVEIYVATQAVDLRYGYERLGGLVREWMGREPRSRGLFVFVGKRGTAIKILTCDSSGQILVSKRLDRGVFERPERLGIGGFGDSTQHRILSDAVFATWFSGTKPSQQKTTRRVH